MRVPTNSYKHYIINNFEILIKKNDSSKNTSMINNANLNQDWNIY